MILLGIVLFTVILLEMFETGDIEIK